MFVFLYFFLLCADLSPCCEMRIQINVRNEWILYTNKDLFKIQNFLKQATKQNVSVDVNIPLKVMKEENGVAGQWSSLSHPTPAKFPYPLRYFSQKATRYLWSVKYCWNDLFSLSEMRANSFWDSSHEIKTSLSLCKLPLVFDLNMRNTDLPLKVCFQIAFYFWSVCNYLWGRNVLSCRIMAQMHLTCAILISSFCSYPLFF